MGIFLRQDCVIDRFYFEQFYCNLMIINQKEGRLQHPSETAWKKHCKAIS